MKQKIVKIMFQILLLFSVVSFSYSAAIPVKDFQELISDYKDFLPSELVNIYNGLSDKDRDALKYAFDNSKDEIDFIAKLKSKSPELGERFEKMYEKLAKKMESLDKEAKDFVKHLRTVGRRLHSEYVNGKEIDLEEIKKAIRQEITNYELLSESAKSELKKTFPTITKFLLDDKTKQLVAQVLNTEN